jgi:hypothetical protein
LIHHQLIPAALPLADIVIHTILHTTHTTAPVAVVANITIAPVAVVANITIAIHILEVIVIIATMAVTVATLATGVAEDTISSMVHFHISEDKSIS